MGKAYVMLNGLNSYEAFGLKLVSYNIGRPIPLTKYIEVPGRAGKLDATLALNGKVNYISRSIKIQFHATDNPYSDWHMLISELWRLFEGIESKIIFCNDGDWYYRGRFAVDTEKSNEVTSDIILSCSDAFPYKLDALYKTGNWNYDPAVFEAGVSRAADISINSSKDVICQGFAYNGTVTIYTSAVMSVVFQGNTYQLVRGKNVLRDIHFTEGMNVLKFTGNGKVRIEYERGIL